MYKLSFSSTVRSSLYPVFSDKDSEIKAKVRHTTVFLKEYDNKDALLREFKATVVRNPFEKDNLTLGQKYAVTRLCSQIGPFKETGKVDEEENPILTVTDEGKILRKQVWDLFATSSRAAAKIMKRI